MRQMGCALPKMRFWHAQEIVHEICFELTKQISVSGRALPSAARFEGHTFQSARRIHPLRRSRANCVARRKSVVLLARKFLQKYSRNLFRADETNFREWEGSALCGARPFGARFFYMPQSCPPRRPRPAGLRRAGARACLCKRACLCERMCAYLIARGSVRARLPVPPPSPGESRPLPPRAGGTPPRERGRREDCTPRVSSSFLPARDTPSSAPCTRARPCIWGRAAGWACRRTTPRPGARCAARRSRTGGG